MELGKLYGQLNKSLATSAKVRLDVAADELDTQSALMGDMVDSVKVDNKEMGEALSGMTAAILDTQSAMSKNGGYAKMLSDVEKAYGISGEIKHESATGASVNEAQKITLMVNAARTNQNAFAEEFFPSVPNVDGGNQIKLQYIAAGFITDWSKGNKEITPAFKMLKDTAFLQGLNHKLFPVFDASSTDIIPALKYNEVNGIKTIETAPYVFGKKLDLLDICTDEVTTSGSINNVRTVSPTMNLEKVFFANADNSARLVFNTTGLKNNAFTQTMTGKIEDIQLNFGVGSMFKVKFTDFKKADGSPLVAGYTDTVIQFELVVKGDGNVTRSQLNIQTPTFVLKQIVSGDEVLATDSAAYIAITEAIAEIKPVGFSLGLFEANGDLFNEGTLLTLDNDSEVFNIGYKEPFTVKGGIAQLYNKDIEDMEVLARFVTHFGDKISAAGVTKLLAAYEATKAAQENGESELAGLGNRFVKPTAVTIGVDMSLVLNNMESSKKEESVRSALVSALKTACAKLYNDSGYKAVYNRVYPGRKIRFSVGIGEKLATFLPEGKYDLTSEIEMYIVSTPDIRLNTRILFAFTAAGERNKEADMLSLGFCGYAPTVVAEVKKTIGQSTVSLVAAFPTYEHIVLTNVMGEIELSNLEKLFVGI